LALCVNATVTEDEDDDETGVAPERWGNKKETKAGGKEMESVVDGAG
jgi:hypothetical protein